LVVPPFPLGTLTLLVLLPPHPASATEATSTPPATILVIPRIPPLLGS
jgi:hypothetical protein